jgi:MoCo/4Fe-4S cofactor protein with predicted Tat translocation signal
MNNPTALDALRAQLAGTRGPQFWRALEELVEQPAGRSRLREAFPQFSQLEPSLDRRGFLKLLGASLAMAGLAACSGPPQEQIVPWVHQPEGMSPSLPRFYATTLRHGNDVAGVLVETHQGRPSKIEGNPKHPASLGATDAMLQAAVLELWDPDRSATPKRQGVIASWDDFDAEAAGLIQRFDRDGRGLHVLAGRIDSPTLARQRQQFLQRFPGARWHRGRSARSCANSRRRWVSPARRRANPAGSRPHACKPWPTTCAPIAATRCCWPVRRSRRPSMHWCTCSTRRWATSVARWSTSIRSNRTIPARWKSW